MNTQPHDRLLTPEDDMIVSIEAMKSEDDFRLVESNAAFVEMLLEKMVAPEEISANAIRCYCVSEFTFQLDNGVFLQYAYNSELDQLAVARLTEGLELIGAKKTLQAYHRCLTLWESLTANQQEAFLKGDFFGEGLTELRVHFEAANQELANARDEEDLIDLAAQWLKGLDQICFARESSFSKEVKKRVAKIPDLDERRSKRASSIRPDEEIP